MSLNEIHSQFFHAAMTLKRLDSSSSHMRWKCQVYEDIFGQASSSEFIVHPNRGGGCEFAMQITFGGKAALEDNIPSISCLKVVH